jgi:type IV secretory pathway TraG/TraD family ATPase VirD4
VGFLSELSDFARRAMPAAAAANDTGEWEALFGQTGAGAGIPLGTARWLAPESAVERFRYSGSLFAGRVWIGQGFDRETSPLGYDDDRHVCLVSGSRGGKGIGVIIPNLCFWPGSAIVVDPKGENATVTARRRGGGSAWAHGCGQKVCILDPFGEVQLPAPLKARYNPLDAIDPKGELAIDDAGRIAAALVVVESRTEPYWELAARNLIKGLILHVISASYLSDYRNLLGVRRLLTQGDWLTLERMRATGEVSDDEMPSAFQVLWSRMRRNRAFNGVVAGVGEQMIGMAEKQLSGVLEAARTNTEFLDSIPMQRILGASDFDLGELKTNPRGLTVYLTLPQRFMETHYRWLRLMIVLAVGEMERIKGRPATGHPTLFLLDEFAGLKRMEVIENAAAQAAGFGIKFMFVVQNLAQLNEVYEKSWETFFGNSGLKMFFQIDDDFSRQYLSRQLGELETVRQTRSGSQSSSTSDSVTTGDSWSENTGGGITRSPWLHLAKAHQRSWGRSSSGSRSSSRGESSSATEGWGEGVHKRPLLNPDEIGRLLARVDDRRRPGYPGLVLALVPGEHPLLARRVNYFESPYFLTYFDPHPNYPPPPTLAQIAADAARRAAEQTAPPQLQFRKLSPGKWAFWGFVGIFIIAAVIHANWSSSSSTGQRQRPIAAAAETNPAYARGVADWDALQTWVSSQTGDRRAGVDYWATNRNVTRHASCAQEARTYSGDAKAFAAGCENARSRLAPIDERRADPQYRAGFSDEAKRSPL